MRVPASTDPQHVPCPGVLCSVPLLHGKMAAAKGSYYGTISTLRSLLYAPLPETWHTSTSGSVSETDSKPAIAVSRGSKRASLANVFNRDEEDTRTFGHSQEASTSTLRPNAYRSAEPVAAVKRTDIFDTNDQDDKILFQAGTSKDPYSDSASEELPLLVLCPGHLEDTDADKRDAIVKRLMQRLEVYAQEPYLLVLFASPSPSIPVQQLVSYYRALSSDARRNIRRLWICHAGLLARM